MAKTEDGVPDFGELIRRAGDNPDEVLDADFPYSSAELAGLPGYYRAVGDGEHILMYRVDKEKKVVIIEGILKFDEVPTGVEILAAPQ